MGDPSIWLDEDLWLNCSVQQFLSKYLAFYNVMNKRFSANTGVIDKYHDMLDDDSKEKMKEYITLFSIEGLTNSDIAIENFEDIIVNDNGQVSLESLDEMKIQGYWYDDFCYWLAILWCCGLRGDVEFRYTVDDSLFNINFRDDDVTISDAGEDSILEIPIRNTKRISFIEKIINLKEVDVK